MIKLLALGFPYIRLLTEDTEKEDIERLKKVYGYIFVVSYKPVKPIKDFIVEIKQASIIDLAVSLEAVFKKFKINTQKEIRQAERNQDLIFKEIDSNLNEVYACYKNFEKRRGWMPAPKAEMRSSLIFSAYYKGKVIAGITCYRDRDFLRVDKIFSLRYSNDKSQFKNAVIGQATRKLIWNICQYAKVNGYKMFDLGGVNFIDSKKIGISNFKQSFGGDIKTVYICRHQSWYFPLIKKMFALAGYDIT